MCRGRSSIGFLYVQLTHFYADILNLLLLFYRANYIIITSACVRVDPTQIDFEQPEWFSLYLIMLFMRGGTLSSEINKNTKMGESLLNSTRQSINKASAHKELINCTNRATRGNASEKTARGQGRGWEGNDWLL